MAVNDWGACEGDADGAFHQGDPSRRTFVALPWLPNLVKKPGYVIQVMTCVYGKVEAAARFNDKLVAAQTDVGQTLTRGDKAAYVRYSDDGKDLLGVCTSHVDDMIQFEVKGGYAAAESKMQQIGKFVKLKPASIRPLSFNLGRMVVQLKDGAIGLGRRAKIDELVQEHDIVGTRKQPARTGTDFHTRISETEQQNWLILCICISDHAGHAAQSIPGLSPHWPFSMEPPGTFQEPRRHCQLPCMLIPTISL